MQTFSQILEDRHAYARDWKRRTGGKVLGYYCTYFPEELAFAAGILPVRILAKHFPDDSTDRLMYGNCYVTRDMFNQFNLGHYDYVDGLVSIESCQWWYNAFDVTVQMFPNLWNYYLYTPDYPDANRSKDVMRSELAILKGKFEEWTGNPISDAALDNAIDIYNTNRRLLRRLYELRRFNRPVILGSEAMEIMLANQIMDKSEANAMLEQLIPQIEDREPYEDRIRFILIGSETHDAELEKLIEDAGGNVVIDELDNGSSYIWNEVIPLKDRLMAIGLRYMSKPHSALKDNVWRRRPEQIFRLSEDFQVDAAIIAKQIYCHPHGTDMYSVWKLLRERNIPYHTFERDTTLPYEETRLGVEALINMVAPGMTRVNGWSERNGRTL